MKICVIGLGYIGLPTACLMASAGHTVVGVDVSEAVVAKLRSGKVHVTNEPGLGELAQSVLASGALSVSTTPVEADVYIVCVPTPLTTSPIVKAPFGSMNGTQMETAVAQVAAGSESNGQGPSTTLDSVTRPTVDLSHVQSAVESIVPVVRQGNLVIVESTVPPGTTEHVVLPIFERNGLSCNDVLLAHAPERVIPGAILHEMVENDRVIGGLTPEATEAAKELYASAVKGRIVATDATTAEFVKLIENTYRDVNIALANELARVAEHLAIDVQQAILLANRHPRVNILNPGPGVGGHCIPVDPHFIIERAPELTPLMQIARAINNGMVDHVVNIVDKLSKAEHLNHWVILGAAYKADVGDERNSPYVDIADRLGRMGYSFTIHDPYIESFSGPLESVVGGADGLLLLTDHKVYRELDPSVVAPLVSRRFIVDTRLCLDVPQWESQGFVVRRLGDGRSTMVRMR